MERKPFDVPDEALEVESAGTGGEGIYVLENGESVELKIPDDIDAEEDHDNVEYD